MLGALSGLLLIGPAAGDINATVNYSGFTVMVRRQVILKCDTFPTNGGVYIHDGSTWVYYPVGPATTPPERLIEKQASMTGYTQYIVGAFKSNNSIPAVIGATVDVMVPAAQLNLAYAPTYAAINNGPITQLMAYSDAQKFTVAYATAAFGTIYSQAPPVYIKYIANGEGGGGVQIDNGIVADNDHDGIEDSVDPDDDNDGSPDTSDAFPMNASEKDDTDHDGIGNNADDDDDNDGHKDTEDDSPYDGSTWFTDTDGDGVPNWADRFPNNSRESKDTDGDGIGDNQDPDDHTPPPSDPNSPAPGNGNGDPGTGDGGGGPGPVPKPTDGGTDTGTAGTGDTAGEVKPTTAHDVAGALNGLGSTVPGKVGNFNPMGNTAFPTTMVYQYPMNFGLFGTHVVQVDFSKQPWPTLRILLLILMTYNVGVGVVKQIKI